MSHHETKLIYSHNGVRRLMSDGELDQIVAAIATGKYSWACVLILRLTGYNPLHYLPYRTYRRLVKENSQVAGIQSQNEVNEFIEFK